MKKRTNEERFLSMKEYIIENFDFRKCEVAMKKLNWTWFYLNGTPNVDDLKSTASQMLESAAKGCLESKDCKPDVAYISSTGGLKATAMKNKYNQLEYLNLEFVLTDWSADDDD